MEDQNILTVPLNTEELHKEEVDMRLEVLKIAYDIRCKTRGFAASYSHVKDMASDLNDLFCIANQLLNYVNDIEKKENTSV